MTQKSRENKEAGKAANYALLCKTYLLLKWRTVAAGKGIWLARVRWSHRGKVWKIPTALVKWSCKQQTGTFWVLCMDPAQSSAGYSCCTSSGESTVWECARFSGAGPSHFTCCRTIAILSGVTATFSLAAKHHPREMFHHSLNPRLLSTLVPIQGNTYISTDV